MADNIQTSFPTTHDKYVAGQIANTMPASCETGRLATGTVPFGYAVYWSGDGVVTKGNARQPIGRLTANLSNSATTIPSTVLLPSVQRPAVGNLFLIGSELIQINAVGSGVSGNDANGFTVARGHGSSTAADHAAGSDIYQVQGGRTKFAGVAVRNAALPGSNTPVDTYNVDDLVTVGNYGDFIVVCSVAPQRGDPASVYVGADTSTLKTGMFSNNAENDASYIGIPGAVFTSAGDSFTPFNQSSSIILATLRLTRQPG